VSVAKASAEFGFSRVAFYDIQRAWMRDGMNGLLPRPRGPKHGHKLTEDVIAFARSIQVENPSLRTADLVGRIAERFDIKVHPRTVERALEKEPKKGLPA
jgi:transposase